MTLEIGNFTVENVVFDAGTRLHQKTLFINKGDLQDFLLRGDARIKALEAVIAKPGDATRIIAVKDVIEPRCKVLGRLPGAGRLHALKNIAVITCGKIVGYQEGIIDMSGPGALYTPFSKTLNIVLQIEVVPGLSPHQHEDVLRKTGLEAAAFLAETARDLQPDETKTFISLDSTAVSADLPRIAYIYMLLSQGLLHDTYVFGRNAKEGLPVTISLPELMDNAIVSGNCVSACDKNTTYHHQNNPLLMELYQRHDKELNFVGIVLTNEPIKFAAKQASARKTIELISALGAEGVIISKEGFGNPDADQMMLISGLERRGIKTCAIMDEYPGPDGLSQSLADATKEADAVISVGNANEQIILPAMAHLLGPVQDLTKLAGAYPQSLQKDGSLKIELQGIIGSTNELGHQKMSCKEV